MADETKQLSPEIASVAPAKEETVVEKTVAETAVPEAEPKLEIPEKEATVVVVEDEVPKKTSDDDKIGESPSFKEETNVAADLPNPQLKALDEFKELVRQALNKHEFTPPPPPPVKEEEKKAEPETVVSQAEEESKSETIPVAEPAEVAPPVKEELPKVEEKTIPPPPAVETAVETPPPSSEAEAVVISEKVEQKEETIEGDASKTVEEIKETIVEVTTPPPPPPAAEEETTKTAEPETPPPPPEEVSIWGVKLLEDEKTDTILLKFLRARDFKVKEAFTMLKSVVTWRKEFGIDSLLEEDNISEGVEKIVYSHGVDKEGHPVIYNTFGEFQNKELYQNTFADAEKRTKFLKGIIQFLEKSIRDLDFTPDGISTLFQVIDLKNAPGLFFFKKDLRQAVYQALQLFQDNYPEFVAKQVYINVPWWYPASYKMISAIFTLRTKSKFVFAGPSRSAETLFKYIVPEKVPVQYGGLSREGEQEFTTDDSATEESIKPSSKHSIEFEVAENSSLVWEVRVVGWDVSYGAEFVPSAEGGYTVIVQKSRKIGVADETVISTSYKSVEQGKVVLTFDNQTSKKKKLLYRSKTKTSE